MVLAILALFVSSCTKEDNNTPTTAANGLMVYKNKTGDVNANALQAQYKDPKFDIYFYGNFDANNDPTAIKTVSFQKAANDTIMNMTIDPATNRITSASTTVKGVQQAVVMKFDYLNNATNDYNLSYYNYNWTTQTGQLFYSTLIENKNGVTLGKPNYAARLNGTKTFDYKLAIESLLFSTKIVTAGVVAAALIPEAAIVTATLVLIPGIATGWYFNSAVTVFSNLVLGGNVQAAEFFPPNTPITNPVSDTTNPIPHLQISSCVNNNITFTATMDATGAIIFTTINGGQAPYTYLVNSGFQQSTVFANNYKDGSYILAVKDANGCVNMKVMPLVRETKTLAIGDAYQGGFISYIDGTGLHGLITTTQVIQCHGNEASAYCDNFVNDGFSDWHLPSKEELIILSEVPNRCFNNILDQVFWSTYIDGNGYYFNRCICTGGGFSDVTNDSNLFAMPIRAF